MMQYLILKNMPFLSHGSHTRKPRLTGKSFFSMLKNFKAVLFCNIYIWIHGYHKLFNFKFPFQCLCKSLINLHIMSVSRVACQQLPTSKTKERRQILEWSHSKVNALKLTSICPYLSLITVKRNNTRRHNDVSEMREFIRAQSAHMITSALVLHFSRTKPIHSQWTFQDLHTPLKYY